MIQRNEILSISIKRPPDPVAHTTLGVFTSVTPEKLISLLSEVPMPPEQNELFKENVKDAVRDLLNVGEVLATRKEGNLYTITIRRLP